MTPDTITVRFLGRDVALERANTDMLRYEADVDGLDLEVKRPYTDAGYWCASFEGTHSLIDADIQGAVITEIEQEPGGDGMAALSDSYWREAYYAGRGDDAETQP